MPANLTLVSIPRACKLMGIYENESKTDNGTKRKTPIQLQSLEKFYLEDKYPKKEAMEEYAATLNLTYRQVRGWFIERRRKEKKEQALCPEKRNIQGYGRVRESDCRIPIDSRNKTNDNNWAFGRKNWAKSNDHVWYQALYSKEYILKKIFRKDGPPLGVEFDPVPPNAFGPRTRCMPKFPNNLTLACRDGERIPQRREVLDHPIMDFGTNHEENIPPKKYGIGKGLMNVWRATNSTSHKFPFGVSFVGDSAAWKSFRPNASSKDSLYRISKRLQRQKMVPVKKTQQDKLPEKRKSHMVKRKVPRIKDVNKTKARHAKCKLAVSEQESIEQFGERTALVDDEELELRELQAGPNPPRCSAHLPSNGHYGCPLCKDLLARFPPEVVKMKQPFCTKPWDSSPELVKKLFKVFQFLYAHASSTEIYPFTLDEFAQAFHDQESMLLGKIHVALLKLLLLDAEKVMSAGFIPRVSNDCRFLGFLQFVKEQEFDVKFWCQSLNSLTWIEILRLVLVASGFGSKRKIMRKENFDKERSRMEKYGLRPLTLKGELFRILSERGSAGMKVSQLAKTSQISFLGLFNTIEELEQAICSTLSSDITLFEKIGHSAFRLRVDPHIKGEDSQSEDDDLGSVDDDSDSSSTSDSDSSDDLGKQRRIVRHRVRDRKKCLKVTEDTSIDESYSGEPWVLGLMEAEYSNLSIEEKLDALSALVDLAASSSRCQIEESVGSLPAINPTMHYHGSGAKIKKATPNHHLMAKSMLERPVNREEGSRSTSNSSLVNTSLVTQKSSGQRQLSRTESRGAAEESGPDSHPVQSIYLGSDRRYNSYWLFLGPCDGCDPGHRRVYFESSEDGHWEVIDTTQALRGLLSVLDCRGTREAHLFASLEKREVLLCEAMDACTITETSSGLSGRLVSPEHGNSGGDGSSPISDVDNVLMPSESSNSHLVASGAIILEHAKNVEGKRQRWHRLQAFDKWIWDSFYSTLNAVRYCKRSYMESLARCEDCHDLYWRDERHCKICHTTFELDFDLEERYTVHVATCRAIEGSSSYPTHKVLSSQLQALKAAIYAIEVGMPEAALLSSWTRSSHKLWIKRLRRTSSLPELLQVLTDFVGAINEEGLYGCAELGSNTAIDGVLLYFQTMPQTTSAVALWMLKLDALIGPHLQRSQSEKMSERVPVAKRKRMCTR